MSSAASQPHATPASWYSIRKRTALAAAAQGVPSAAEIFIYGDIGESFWTESVSAANFVRDLNALDAEQVTIRINSIGGSVPDGIAIHNAIKRHKAKTTTVIDGMALSIASLIALAGDTVEMADNATMMVHAPWTYMAGNSQDMREQADVLDTWAQAMATSYAAKSGKDKDEMLALLTDGKDHWYTAAEALDMGFVDSVVQALPIAASAAQAQGLDLSRFRNVPAALLPSAAAAAHASAPSKPQAQPAPKATSAAAAATTLENPSMTTTVTPAAANPATPDAAAIAAQALAADQARRGEIRAAFAKFGAREGVAELQAACEDDVQCTAQAAGLKLLAHLGKDTTPVAGHVVTVTDEADKRRAGIVDAIMARAGVASPEQKRAVAASPFRGATLLDVARASLKQAGIKTDGMDKMQIVATAFTQSTSDFPILLENTMHKTLQSAYATQPDTWSRFCARGSVSDFRAHNRYRVGSLSNLDTVNELGEFTNKTIPDGEKASIAATTRGNIINLSRQAIVNDDLGAFVGLAQALGRAARRTVEAEVYTVLKSNGGLGPTLADGQTLFHASHNNITTSAAIAVAALDLDRVAMASQLDVGGNDFLDLRPAVLVVPLGLGGTARVINDAQYDPDTANKLQRPNQVRGLFSDIVDTPRLTGNRRYLFANPSEAPCLEVAFLDGNDTPYLELENGFTVDGARWKVRLDFGIAGIDYRGAVTNAGG